MIKKHFMKLACGCLTLVALASVLFMANAEDEEALRLAGEVAGQGLARLGRMTKKNVNDLYQVLEQADEQLQREPMQAPRLAIKRRPPSIFDYEFDDFEIVNYEPHAHIKAAVAV